MQKSKAMQLEARIDKYKNNQGNLKYS